MPMLAELEQEVATLIDELGDEHTVSGSETPVTCYLGRERRVMDDVLMVFRVIRTYAGRASIVGAPVPDGEVEIDGAIYIVDSVSLYGDAFKAEIYRRR